MGLSVHSEVGRLRRVMVHRPDRGIGAIVPAKAQEWLYEDIVHLETMQEEHDVFKQILLAFLDPASLVRWFRLSRGGVLMREPGQDPTVSVVSESVVEAEDVLEDLLADEVVRRPLLAAVCGIEGVPFRIQDDLAKAERTPSALAKLLVSGIDHEGRRLFLPIPNFIFTRDLGAVLGDRFVVSRFAKRARLREGVLSQYMATHSERMGGPGGGKLIELDAAAHPLVEPPCCIEGGDVMSISPRHVLIGCSERTSHEAVEQLVDRLFRQGNSQVNTVSVVDLPKARSTMHLDTVLTQVARDTWVLHHDLDETQEGVGPSRFSLGFGESGIVPLNRQINVAQFRDEGNGRIGREEFGTIQELLTSISRREFDSDNPKFVYCGGGRSPHSAREQWADGCNLLAIQDGVAVAYDRNEYTSNAFKEISWVLHNARELIADLEEFARVNSLREENPPDIKMLASEVRKMVGRRAVILIPSSELCRARGGSHCLTLPLSRDSVS